jgi:hypothetical protein
MATEVIDRSLRSLTQLYALGPHMFHGHLIPCAVIRSGLGPHIKPERSMTDR